MNKSEAFQNMCTKYNITPKIRSPYSSRSLGLCERVHRTIQESMRALIASYDITWLDASPLAVGMYNSLTHSALNNYSPYEVFFGKTSPFVRAPTLPDTPPGRLQEVVKEHNKQVRTMRKVVERLDREYKQKIRNQFQGIEKAFLAG